MPSATLTLRRRWGGVVRRSREYEIELDGEQIASIAKDGTVELPIEPGHHTLRLGQGRFISPTRSFDAADGDVVSFWCRGALFWPRWVAALIKPDLWITLRRE